MPRKYLLCNNCNTVFINRNCCPVCSSKISLEEIDEKLYWGYQIDNYI